MNVMEIIPRSKWGARYPNGFGTAPLPAQEVWLHHSVTVAPDLIPPFEDDYAAVRTLEQIGQTRFGGGISYTWVITPAGLIFEGHGVDRIGSHTKGRNLIARAICLIGNYQTAKPTSGQISAAAWLLQHARRSGWVAASRLNGGHRNAPGAQTACPGDNAIAVIPMINQLAAGGPVGEDDMFTDDDRFKLIQTWQTLFRSKEAPGGLTLYDHLYKQNALLAAIAAEQQDDLDGPAVLAHLDASVTQMRTELTASVANELAAIRSAIEAENTDQAKAIVDELVDRLRPDSPSDGPCERGLI